MLRATGLLGLVAVMVLAAVAIGAQPPFVDISKAVPTGALQPYVIPEQLQKIAVELKVPSNFKADAYIAVFKFAFSSDQLFYTDLLAGVDVLAQAWAKRRGATLSVAAYRSLVCFFSVPLPGCRPKSKSNRDVMQRVRERLLVGTYGSEKKRSELTGRLTPRFFQLESIESIDLEAVEIQQYINVSDLLK